MENMSRQVYGEPIKPIKLEKKITKEKRDKYLRSPRRHESP